MFVNDTYKCVERVSVPKLNRMILHLGGFPNLRDDDKKYLELQKLKIIKKRAGSVGRYDVNFALKDYDTGNTRALGRLYAKGASLQHLGKEYRKALVYEEYTDIDIKNAHPSLMNQVFKKEGVECKMLNEYVENRGKFLEVVDKTQWMALLNNRIPKESSSYLEKEYWSDIISSALGLFELPWYNTYLEKGKKQNPTNPIGWAISQLATDKERETVSHAMMYLKGLGYKISTLIHDGFLVQDLNVKEEHLRDAEARVFEATGFRIELVRKPLNNFNREEVFGPEPDSEEEEDDGVGGDKQNALVFLHWMTEQGHRFVKERSGSKEIWWYNPEDGVYALNEKLSGLRIFMGACTLLDEAYTCMTRNQDNLKAQFRELIPIDEDLFEKMFQSTYRKLAFQNGIYDFEKKKLVDFSSEYFFTFKAPVELKLEGNEEMEKLVYKKLFIDVFGDPEVNGDGTLNYSEKKDEKALYYKKILARAIAGEIYDKNFFIVIGLGNSGKGTNTDGLVGAFGNFTDNVNAGSFTKKLGDDQAKARSWMVKLKNTRIAYANEISMDASLDASVIKTVSSGGDPITARQNYGDECTFRLQTTAIFFVNDMPKVKGQDDATTNRLKYIETSYSYLQGDLYESQKLNPNVRKADSDLKSVWMKRKDVLEAYASLVVKAYEKEEPVAPNRVIEESREWTVSNNDSDKFGELFEATGNEYDTLTPKDVAKIAEKNGILASPKRLGERMKMLGFTSTSTTRNGKKVRLYKGVREVVDREEVNSFVGPQFQ